MGKNASVIKMIAVAGGAGLLLPATVAAASLDSTVTTVDTASLGLLGQLMTGGGVVVLVILTVVACAFSIFHLWMIIDCLKRSDAEMPNKVVWLLVLILGGIVLWAVTGLGWITAIVYYFAVKRKLDQAAKATPAAEVPATVQPPVQG